MASDTLIHDMELPFQLYEVLNTQALCEHARFNEHSRETFDAVLETANKIATDLFLPHNHIADKNEPTFDGKTVSMIDEVKVAFDAFREAGFIAGRYNFEDGGMQLPETVMTAVSGYFMAANPSTTAYPFLTAAAINVINHFASDTLKAQFMPRMLTGEFTGTMALTEPHAGSSLADIKTTAVKQADGSYRLKGSKIYISGGEHELSENIVHLVLAKVPGGPAGVKGISLFVVPKYRLNENGEIDQRNDVQLAGLLHKLGYRGTTSTALTFGENDDCHGYLVGEEHFGLRYMFMMMNEARIGVGFGAAMIGYRGFQYSLDYAKDRTQGRVPPHNKPEDPAAPIIHHGDVKRMLLAQKAYSEGGMALCLYGSNLIDRINTCQSLDEKEGLQEMLDLLTPVLKAWPSEYGPKANDLGIQVLGGSGYTREYFAEQFWRDNRLNPIHEGTNGIQALDLTFRKLWQKNGLGLKVLQAEIQKDLSTISTPETAKMAKKLGTYLKKLHAILMHIAECLQSEKQLGLSANAQAMMNVFAIIVVSWIWLRQANVAEQKLAQIHSAQGNKDGEQSDTAADFYKGKVQAAKYFFAWELPAIERDLQILESDDDTCATMQPDWF
uniref:acyl-CoA dehydrogenase n=1 Tax=Ningiella ruwaisensis TaxID=2364274 RepID=UPI00109F808B|nr:acyl-CoA dehydrogenase [Ningiella ruwaisensis]